MPTPRTACSRYPQLSTLLWRAAMAMAMDINLDLKLQSTQTPVLKALQGMFAPGGGNFAASTKLDELTNSDLDAQSHYAPFCKRFGEACGRGRAMLTYLNEKLAQTDRSLQNVAYKFAAVDEINAEVMKEVNAAINRTQRIKTGAEVAFLFLSTFGGGPLATGTITWAKNTALGVALTVGTEFASTLGEIQAADLGDICLRCAGRDRQGRQEPAVAIEHRQQRDGGSCQQSAGRDRNWRGSRKAAAQGDGAAERKRHRESVGARDQLSW